MTQAKDLIKRAEHSIGKAVGILRKITGYLGPSDDWIEGARRRILVPLHPAFALIGRPLIRHANDEDYMYTVDKHSDAVERALDASYQRNAASTRKFRYVDVHGNVVPKGEVDDCDGARKQWAAGSWVLDPDDAEWQHHVYLFDAGDIGRPKTDIYGHKEISAEQDPSGHVSEPQEHGDPDENVIPLLADKGISRVKQ